MGDPSVWEKISVAGNFSCRLCTVNPPSPDAPPLNPSEDKPNPQLRLERRTDLGRSSRVVASVRPQQPQKSWIDGRQLTVGKHTRSVHERRIVRHDRGRDEGDVLEVEDV